MRIYGIRVFVHDLRTARVFYEEILGLKSKWAYGGSVGYDLGVNLILEEVEAGSPSSPLIGRFTGCSIAVDNINVAYEGLVVKGGWSFKVLHSAKRGEAHSPILRTQAGMCSP
jgi:hypothetical protein